MKKYLAVFLTHPIQYYAAIWRKLAARDDVRVHVYYANDFSIRGAVDPDFGVPVKWDVPILEGYPSTFIKNVSKDPSPASGFWCVNCPEIKEIIRREPFDGILINGYWRMFEWQVLRAAAKKGVPVMLRGDSREGAGIYKGFFFETARTLILKQLYKRMAIGLAVGKYMRRHFKRNGLDDWQIVDSPHCIDDELFERQREMWLPQRETIRAELGIRPEGIAILFSGKLIPRKQPLLLAEALRHIRARENVWAIVVGDGELRADCERAFREALGDRAIFPGFVNQSRLGRYYVAADLFALPSALESWGLVVNEAMVMGLPVVVSNRVAAHEDLVLPGKTGYMFPYQDAAALTQCLDRMIEDPRALRQMGENARRHIEGYSVKAAADGVAEAFRRLQEHGRLPVP